MKEKISELIIVEGRHDSARLKSFFNCDTLETSGNQISKECLDRIEETARNRGIIVFTDPDSPGERIRRLISQRVPNAKHAFIDKKLARTSRKVGIEHASKEDLWNSLKNCVTFQENRTSLEWSDFIDLGLTGSQTRRFQVCEAFHLGPCNAKTCFKRLNAAGISRQEIERIFHADCNN